MATVTDDELFERTVRSLIGGTMGPPKYIYRGMVSGLVLDIAKRHFHDTDLAKLPKVVDHLTDRVMEAIASLDLYIDNRERAAEKRVLVGRSR
jgi:hypothetical protein